MSVIVQCNYYFQQHLTVEIFEVDSIAAADEEFDVLWAVASKASAD